MSKYHILTLNQISSQGLHRFPGARYAVGKAVEHPDAILVRSHDMLEMAIPGSVKAIGVPAPAPTTFRWPKCRVAVYRCSTRRVPTPTR